MDVIGGGEQLWVGEELLLDLYTLLVLVKGTACDSSDIWHAWHVAAERLGSDHRAVVDVLADSSNPETTEAIAQEYQTFVMVAAARLARRDDDRPPTPTTYLGLMIPEVDDDLR